MGALMSNLGPKLNINNLLDLITSTVNTGSSVGSCGPAGATGVGSPPNQSGICKSKVAVSTIQMEEVIITRKSKYEGDSAKTSEANALCPPKNCKCQKTWTRETEMETDPFYKFKKIVSDGCGKLQDQTDRCGKPKGRTCYARESDLTNLIEGDNTLREKKNSTTITKGSGCCKSTGSGAAGHLAPGETEISFTEEIKRTGRTKNVTWVTSCY